MTRLIEISFQDAGGEIAGLRNHLGQFQPGGLTAQRARNETIALQIQAQVVQRMRNRISMGKRAQASTGRLLTVTASNGNRRSGQWEMGVGVPKFLDRSQAKYWRTFEQGSAAVWSRPFIGTQLLQVRKNPGRFPSAHSTDLRTAGAGFRYPGESRFVVTKEIDPANIYRDVARDVNIVSVGTQQALRVLQRVFEREVRPGGGYFG